MDTNVVKLLSLRKEHGKVYVVEVEDFEGLDFEGLDAEKVEELKNENTFKAICKDPTFKVLGALEQFDKSGKTFDAINMVFNNCVIEASPEIYATDLYKAKVAGYIMSRAERIKADSGKLN